MTSSNGNIFCVTGHLVPGEFPAQRPVTRSFDVFFDLHLNKRLSKQSWGWWFETLSCPLWRHCNDIPEIYLSETERQHSPHGPIPIQKCHSEHRNSSRNMAPPFHLYNGNHYSKTAPLYGINPQVVTGMAVFLLKVLQVKYWFPWIIYHLSVCIIYSTPWPPGHKTWEITIDTTAGIFHFLTWPATNIAVNNIDITREIIKDTATGLFQYQDNIYR